MKSKLLRTTVFVGTLVFILSSTSLYADTTKVAASSSPIHKYVDVAKYGDNKVENTKESNANIQDPAEIKKLTNLGFTKDEIATFSVSEYEKYKNLNGKVVSKSEKYFRVTKDSVVEINQTEMRKESEEYKARNNVENFSLLSTGVTDTESKSWLTMTTTVSDLGSKRFVFKNSFNWLNLPVIVLDDVIGLSHNSSISVDQDSEYFKYTYDLYYDNRYTSYVRTDDVYYWTADAKNNSGYAFEYDLLGLDPNNGYYVSNNRGYMVYTGIATPSSYVGYSNAYGHYAHKQLALSTSISIVSGKLSCTPTLAFDNMTDTDVQFYIN